MKKLIMSTLMSLLLASGMSAYAQQDSAKAAEEPKDTISIDGEGPKYYEEEAPAKSSNTTTYAIIAGVVVVGGIAFAVLRKKKK
jgi:LPXTG-motif cell wall-anchored protein